MAINTLITIKDALTAFVAGHGQLKAIKFEADDHRAPVITESDSFPLLFVAPIDVQVGRAMNAHTLRIYVYERINDDRSDVLENANDTSLILRDIRVWWNDYGVDDIEIKEDPTGIFVSDRELDNLVGYYADIRFEIPSHGRCSVPVDITPIDPITCADADYQITDTDDNILYSGTIPSGGSLDQVIADSTYLVEYVNGTPIENGSILAEGSAVIQVPNPIVCEDATYTITDTDLNTLYTGSIPSGGDLQQPIQDSTAALKDTADNVLSTTQILAEGSEDIVAPDATYTVEYLNGTPIQSGNILSGGFELIQVPNPITCADAVVNVNSVFFDNVASGGTLNIQVRKSTGSNLVGSKQGQHWRIGDSTAVLKTTGGATISTTSIRAEESEDITAPDTEIEVNGVSEGSVVAGATVDIQLSDSLGVVTPISVTQTGNDFAVVLPDAPPAVTRSTATLMKTGQTTSYRTGDDGDLEAGRATDFLTLDAAPLHNDGTATINTTTARFTDTLGGSTYANDIILDWSTWNGSTLLGWYRVINVSNVTWNTAIDNCLAVTVGAFTTGWRLPNRAEIFNICLHEGATLNLPLNYTPFNISLATVFYTSTTQAATTTNCFTLTNNSNVTLGVSTKTGNGRYFPVRTFSLSLLNVLS